MIPWIRISHYKEMIRSKLTWLLLGLCLVTFLAIVIWPREAKKESVKTREAKKESIKTEEVEKLKNEPLAETPMTQKAGQEGLLPQKWPSEEPEEAETDIIIKTVQGRVTDYEICTDTVTVDGIGLDAGSLDLTGVRIGDVVEITYKQKKYGSRTVNVVESVEVIGSSQESTRMEIPAEEEPSGEPEEAVGWEELTEEEALGEPEEAVEWEELTEEEPSEEPEEAETDFPKTMQGRVTDHEICTDTVTVDSISFQPGSVDLTGIQTGDIVEITYTKNEYGLVLESIVLIERRH